MPIKDTIFVGEADQIILGEDAFAITYWIDQELASSFKVMDFRYVQYPPDESWYKVTLARKNALETVLLSFTYQSVNGMVGFNEKEQKVAGKFLTDFLKDAWIWTPRTQALIAYRDVEGELDYPSQFIWLGWEAPEAPRPHTFICFHAPTSTLTEKMDSSRSSMSLDKNGEPPFPQLLLHTKCGMSKLHALLEMAESCSLISIWSPDLSIVRIVSTQGHALMQRLSALSDKLCLELKTVTNEKQFPVW